MPIDFKKRKLMLKKRIWREKQSSRRAWKHFLIIFGVGIIITILAYIATNFIAEEFKLISTLTTFVITAVTSIAPLKVYSKHINIINRLTDLRPLYRYLEKEFKQLDTLKLKKHERDKKLEILETELKSLESIFWEIYGSSSDA